MMQYRLLFIVVIVLFVLNCTSKTVLDEFAEAKKNISKENEQICNEFTYNIKMTKNQMGYFPNAKSDKASYNRNLAWSLEFDKNYEKVLGKKRTNVTMALWYLRVRVDKWEKDKKRDPHFLIDDAAFVECYKMFEKGGSSKP